MSEKIPQTEAPGQAQLDVQVGCEHWKLVKWENDSNGNPMKDKPPLQILEGGDNKPTLETFRRADYATD